MAAPPGASLLLTTILPRAIAASALWVVPVLDRARRCAPPDSQARRRNDDALAERSACSATVKIAGILCVSRVVGKSRVGRPAASASTCFAARGRRRHRPGAGVLRRRDARRPRAAAVGDPPRIRSDARPPCRPGTMADRWEADAGLPGARYRILKDGETTPFEATALRIADGGGLVVERTTAASRSTSRTHARYASVAPAWDDARSLRQGT